MDLNTAKLNALHSMVSDHLAVWHDEIESEKRAAAEGRPSTYDAAVIAEAHLAFLLRADALLKNETVPA